MNLLVQMTEIQPNFEIFRGIHINSKCTYRHADSECSRQMFTLDLHKVSLKNMIVCTFEKGPKNK